MLVSGYFRLPNDIPKPFWRYPMSYISFHFWALQVKYYMYNHWLINLGVASKGPMSTKTMNMLNIFQGQYQNDLMGLMFDNQTPDLPKISGEFILENIFQIDIHRSKWVDLSVIFSMIVIYRVIFFVMIKINEDVTPWVRGYVARRVMQQKIGSQSAIASPEGLTQSPSLRNFVNNRTSGNSKR